MKSISLKTNEPQVLALKETSGVLDGNQVTYETADGRELTLCRSPAIKLNELDLRPEETFGVCKQIADGRFITYSFWLSPETEKRRAEEESPEVEHQLVEALQIPAPRPARRAPTPVRELKPTGTEGAAPAPLPQQRPQIAAKAERQRPARKDFLP